MTTPSDHQPTFWASRAGAAENMSTALIETLPTINRSIQDIARTSPYFNQTQQDAFASALSVAGRNVRYNNIQIDGATNNDVFSIQSSAGTPGGSVETQPISLDVVQELQLVVSPYDVRQGMFSGGGINAITRSGTNELRGSLYYEYTDQDSRAKNPVTTLRETFRERTVGMTVGGPIVKDKLFFFLSYDDFKRVSAPPQANFIPDATQLAAVVARAQAAGGYVAGDLSADNVAFQKTTIAKLDWNALEGQRVSFTYRKNEGETTSFANYTGSTTTSLSNYWYANPRKTESYTGQLNSQWSPDFRTEATVSYTTFDGSPRNAGTPYPQVQVQGISGKRLASRFARNAV